MSPMLDGRDTVLVLSKLLVRGTKFAGEERRE